MKGDLHRFTFTFDAIAVSRRQRRGAISKTSQRVYSASVNIFTSAYLRFYELASATIIILDTKR